jgi:hypothetical protein
MCYDQFMTAVVVSATAFLGITMVFMVQLKQSGLGFERFKKFKFPVMASFVCGILVVLYSLMWFLSPDKPSWAPLVIGIILSLQINWFWPVVIGYWLPRK